MECLSYRSRQQQHLLQVCTIDGRPEDTVKVGPDNLEMVASFCFLGDMLSVGRGW